MSIRRIVVTGCLALAVLTPEARGTAAAQLPPPPISDSKMVAWWLQPFQQPQFTRSEWPWGEQFYDQNAATTLELTNDCYTGQVVTISVHSSLAPMIDIPRAVAVPARSTLSLPVGIIAPPTPHPIPIPGPIAGPLDLHLDIARLPLFITLEGSAAPPGSGAACERGIDQLRKVTGHFHVDPTFTPPYRGPNLTPCDVWWYTGRKPPNFDDDCADRFRALLGHYRDVTLRVLMADDPDAWAWFPTGSLLAAMSAEEILALRERAEAQIAAAGGTGR